MSSLLALDIGEKRTGVAVAREPIYLAHPLTTVSTDELVSYLADAFREHDITTLIVGYPRNQSGESTKQSRFVKKMVDKFHLPEDIAVVFQDESLTSVKAEAELEARKKPFRKEEVDALAATFILEDYVKEHGYV